MLPLRVSLVPLGNLKHPLDLPSIAAWSSKIIVVKHGSSVGHLPDSEGAEWEYPDEQLAKVLSGESEADFTVGLVNAPLEGNYYLRRISNKVAVLSLYEMAEIVRSRDFSLEQYVLRNTYELAVLYAANGKLLPDDYETWAHDETRGCLFDMNSSKSDIVFSLHRPVLCAACKARVLAKQVPSSLVPSLEHELRRIQKPLYNQIADWVKRHPVIALGITAASGVCLNIIASFIYDKLK